jgi:hypothetical protein
VKFLENPKLRYSNFLYSIKRHAGCMEETKKEIRVDQDLFLLPNVHESRMLPQR